MASSASGQPPTSPQRFSPLSSLNRPLSLPSSTTRMTPSPPRATFLRATTATEYSSSGRSATFPAVPCTPHEIGMFNLVEFDQATQSVILANSARASFFSFHVHFAPHDDLGQPPANTVDLIRSLATTTAASSSNPARFDYMVEIPVKHPITSMVVTSDEVAEGPLVNVYTVQSRAVSMYQLEGEVIRPTGWEKAGLLEREEIIQVVGGANVSMVEEERKEQIVATSEVEGGAAVEVVESVKKVETVKEVGVKVEACDEEVRKEVEVAKEIKLSGPVVNGAIAKLKEKRKAEQAVGTTRKEGTEAERAEEEATNKAIRETVNLKKSEKEKPRGPPPPSTAEEEKITAPKKLRNQPAITTEDEKMADASKALRELLAPKKPEKERKERHRGDKGKESVSSSNNEDSALKPETSSASSTPHRLPLADIPRLSPQIPPEDKQAGAKMATASPSGPASPPSPKLNPVADTMSQQSPPLTLPVAGPGGESSHGNHVGMHQMVKELRKVEDNVANKVGKVVGKEMNRQYQRLEEDRIAHQAAETSRQETILKVVSQTLSNNTQKLLEQTIRSEMQNAVIPSLGKIVAAAVEKQIGKGVAETVNRAVPSAIDKSVAENVNKIMSKPAFVESVSKSVAKSLRPLVEDTFKDSFSTLLIPAYQSATTQMFNQIGAAFDQGLQNTVTKSVSDGVADVHSALARMQSSVDALAQQVRDLQAQVAASSPTLSSGRQAQLGVMAQPVPSIQMPMPTPPVNSFDRRPATHQAALSVGTGRYESPDSYVQRVQAPSQQGPLSAGSTGSTLAYRSGSLGQLFPLTVSSHIVQLNGEIDVAIANMDYEDAFMKVRVGHVLIFITWYRSPINRSSCDSATLLQVKPIDGIEFRARVTQPARADITLASFEPRLDFVYGAAVQLDSKCIGETEPQGVFHNIFYPNVVPVVTAKHVLLCRTKDPLNSLHSTHRSYIGLRDRRSLHRDPATAPTPLSGALLPAGLG
ncbi:hypothetical protein BC938DRAFT_476008 [Jimgerdemannia flammicorona]|uniref:Uncharacterized protein n=1 Tax=Jimgerdemannia flammicorona TaxID=994334 RepID=A0A433QR37_9FUNG|nr:hypothetical protein BC938DRAFT_476008 [Jimgerdemannia flammicorona]